MGDCSSSKVVRGWVGVGVGKGKGREGKGERAQRAKGPKAVNAQDWVMGGGLMGDTQIG